jgi:hypothetical protein
MSLLSRTLSGLLRWASVFALLGLAVLPVEVAALSGSVAAADEDVITPPDMPEGLGRPGAADGSGGQDPETAAPDKDSPGLDGPSEDGTPSAEEPDGAPPGGCPFNNAPLELIV